MQTKALLSSFGTPVPELPVRDVEQAQAHYRDKFGFQIGWLYPGGEIGAVSREQTAIFLRRRSAPFEPAVHWVYADDIEETYRELRSLGANVTVPLDRKPWGLLQFTVEDLDGNQFHFHHG
jgi:uncharacterized glyoxalase superfamily protein PhnB